MNTIEMLTLRAASLEFATSAIPSDWGDMDDAAKENWLDKHKSERFEDMSNDEFLELIVGCANRLEKGLVRNVLAELKERIVEEANEDRLPLDMGLLNLKSMLGM